MAEEHKRRHERVVEFEKELKVLEREARENDDIVRSMAKRRNALDSRIRELRNSIDQLKPKRMEITDHAVLRYIERYYNVPVDKYRQEIKDALGEISDVGEAEVAGFRIRGTAVITYIRPGS